MKEKLILLESLLRKALYKLEGLEVVEASEDLVEAVEELSEINRSLEELLK